MVFNTQAALVISGSYRLGTDFTKRIGEYDKVYEPLTDGTSNRHMHFIQLVNVITSHGRIDVNRVTDYLPCKMLFYLLQVRLV